MTFARYVMSFKTIIGYCHGCRSLLRRAYSGEASHMKSLLTHLRARILASGPITVAEYMKEVLTNPVAGYYMHRDVFGSKGDFVTSPEISQMFGELLGVWVINEWMQHGSPETIQVVELGPGRGTLADDMLRVFSQFKEIKNKVSMHLVEVSPKMSEMQQYKLSGSQPSPGSGDIQDNTPEYRQCKSKYGNNIFWYKTLRDVPRKFSCFIAHEFLDALPIHKFQKTERGWSEIFVDFDESLEKLRFVLSKGPTLASTSYLQIQPGDDREHIEVCPEGGVLVNEIADRIENDGGFSLIADYGHTGEKTDTFRGFKDHKLHDVLDSPGTADLTADVDFSYLKKNVKNKVKVFGPITQGIFLHNMGIKVRLKVLYDKAEETQRKDILTGYDMLTNPDQMGERFKFLCLAHGFHNNDYIPAGFVSLQ